MDKSVRNPILDMCINPLVTSWNPTNQPDCSHLVKIWDQTNQHNLERLSEKGEMELPQEEKSKESKINVRS